MNSNSDQRANRSWPIARSIPHCISDARTWRNAQGTDNIRANSRILVRKLPAPIAR
jgi:hypothetical protein